MICLGSKLPVLQVGSHQLKDYSTSWLLKSIEGALERIEVEDKLIAQDIYSGVMHYLQNDCPWVPLKIESLYEKVEKVFTVIGFPNAVPDIPRYGPEVRISVAAQLEALDCQIEIMLFQAIRNELDTLVEYGVEKVVLDEVIEAVSTLIPAKRWTKECQALHDELLSFQEKFNETEFRRNHFRPSHQR